MTPFCYQFSIEEKFNLKKKIHSNCKMYPDLNENDQLSSEIRRNKKSFLFIILKT